MLAAAVACAAAATVSAAPAAPAATVSARLWRGSKGGALHFPEALYPAVAAKPSNAVAFSGGGTRAFSVTAGYLLGLHELDVLRSTRYISSVSGGTWASAQYTYVDPAAGPHVAQNDSQLLGLALPPSALGWAQLDDLPAYSARHCCSVGVGFIPLSGAQYVEKIQSSFLTPLGIPAGASFSYDQATAGAILQRNPTLRPSQLALPHRRSRGFEPPFLIMGITLMGPLASAPLSLSERSYTVFDAVRFPIDFVNFHLHLLVLCCLSIDVDRFWTQTPLYVGQARTSPVTFRSRKTLNPKAQIPNVTLPVGGLIEPFAVGGDAPAAGLPPQSDELVQVSHFLTYQSPACSTDPLTILTAVQVVPSPPKVFSLATVRFSIDFSIFPLVFHWFFH